jgi:hypothetical protein
MTDQTAESIHQSFSSAFFNALVGAITTASGSTWLVAALPDAESAPDEYEPIRIKLSLEGSLEGEFLLQFHLVEAALLASKFLHRPVEEFGQDELEAVLEVVKTAMNASLRLAPWRFPILRLKGRTSSRSLPPTMNPIA